MAVYSMESIYQDSYLTIPRSIYLDRQLSLEAMVLYGFLLDRSKLSEKNKLIDEQGIFVYCTIEEAAQVLRVERKKAIRVFRELCDKQRISRIRQGLSKANKYYVNLPSEVPSEDFKQSQIVTPEVPVEDFKQSQTVTPEVPSEDFKQSLIVTPEVPVEDPSNKEPNHNDSIYNKPSKVPPPPPGYDTFIYGRARCRIGYFKRFADGEDVAVLEAEADAEYERLGGPKPQ